MPPSEEIRPIYASNECEIDLARRELRVLGSLVPVGGRAFEIIEVLAQSAGELVTKNELMDRIWPGAVVMENTLAVHAAAVRKALGPYRNLLKTESRRGYRLLGNWTVRRHTAARPPRGLQRMRIDGECPLSNFPVPVTRLIGRSAAIARLRDLVSAYRVVTLTGPGGIGKTTLALKVARRLLGEFPDGGWLVELASLSDPALVSSAVAGALRLGLGSGSVTPEAIAQAIGDRKLLLVLDNCEHLIEAVAKLAETFLAYCPNITIVATSREILRIQGEYVLQVPPLEVPANEHIDAAEVLGHSAAELFLARAGELGADFASNAKYPSMIGAICRHLDGIPLAIEFAAARAATLGVEEVASGLQNRFMALTNGRRTAMPRHRTLRATLDWSYQLLREAERDLLQRLAIFAGPFSLDAARAVAADGASNGEIANGIADLVSKSLVFRTAGTAMAEFRLLETTRVYAIDRLTERGGLDDVACRHARYFLMVLRNTHQERRSTPLDDYLATCRRRADEVHVALEWAFCAAGDLAVGLALTVAAVPLWFELFQMPTARMRVEQALPHAEAGSDDEMRLRIAFGHALWYGTPDNDAIEATFARALDIAERIGSTQGRTQALWGMWASRRGQGDYPAALGLARQYLDAAEEAGDVGAIHLGHRILGLTHHFLGHQPVAREFTERALSQPHHFDPTLDLGYQAETPIAMGALLARVLWLEGFPDQAAEAAAEAVTAARRSGNLFAIFYAVVFGAVPVALWTGAFDTARRQLDLLVDYAAANRRVEQLRNCFARVLALRNGREGDALIASFIEPRVDQVTAPPFADLTLDANIPVPSPGAEPVNALWNTPELLRVDAELMLWHNAPDAVRAAEAKLLRGLAISREQSALSWELRAAVSLARLWRRCGRDAEARGLLAGTYGKFTEGFGTGDLVRARSLLSDLQASRPTA